MTTAIAADPFASLRTAGPGAVGASSDAASADRFLKLLVTQMQNQDPLNPMDNAQITSQMAQINTVTGLQTLNTSVQGLGAQFVQMQALQGASLVGRDVTIEGDRLAIADGSGRGAFELASPADNVRLEILSGAGLVLASQDLGGAGAGIHSFQWPAGSHGDAEGLRFRVTATSGTNNLGVTPLMHDRVESVSTGGDRLNLQLQRAGSVSYGAIKTVH